jgi:paraquat-inducible protein B
MKASPRLIGAFVVGGVALLIGGVLTFGSIAAFKPHLAAVMFFEEDLTGLDPGAPVTFKGVQIGTVGDIVLRFNSDKRSFQIPVYITVEPDRFQVEGSRIPLGQNVPYFVEQGLRARLASQSILTGKKLIELGFHPDTPAHLSGTKSDRLEIPTIPSQMEALQASVDGLLKKLEQMPLPDLINDLRTTAQSLTNLLTQVDATRIGGVADDASATLRTGREVLENIGKRIDVIGPHSEVAVQNAALLFQDLQKAAARVGPLVAAMQRAAERADRLLADANGVIEPGSQTQRELSTMMREISGAARSMRNLTDELDRNPNSLLFGKTSAKGR